MSVPARRPTLRTVAVPAEHGGWGLTLEPGLLGLLLAPGPAALLLGVAALAAFLVRTPLRILLIDRHRDPDRARSATFRARTALARRVAAVELAVIVAALLVSGLLATEPRWWLPGIVALPLFSVALWFDMRSLSRHLVPEVAGSIAVASVAAMGALTGGAGWPLAIGAWLVLGARVSSSIPHVRAQIARLHGTGYATTPVLLGDAGALVVAVIAVLLEPVLLLGGVAIVGLIVVQRITLVRPPRPAKVLGLRQMVLGFAVVGATAAGAWLL